MSVNVFLPNLVCCLLLYKHPPLTTVMISKSTTAQTATMSVGASFSGIYVGMVVEFIPFSGIYVGVAVEFIPF